MRLRRRPTAAAWILLILVALVAARLSVPQPDAPGELIREDRFHEVERVVDGDTLLLASRHRVRLIGVDTPETKHPDRPVDPLGVEAAEFTQSLVAGGSVRLEFDRERVDQYDRLLAYVYLPDDRLLNEELILAGYSRAETRFPYRSDMKRRFLEAEDVARQAGRGVWVDHRKSGG